MAPLPGASPLANDSSTTAVPFQRDSKATKAMRHTVGPITRCGISITHISITHTLFVSTLKNRTGQFTAETLRMCDVV